jgi:hypothetical protein
MDTTDGLMRSRLERLLGGSIKVDDLTRLFLYARERKRANGRESVIEIGDFIAHHEERTKGISTRTIREFYAVFTFPPNITGKPVDGNRLPKNFPLVLRASLGMVPPKMLNEQTGISHKKAARILEELVLKLTRNLDGTLSLGPVHTETEMNLIQFLCSLVVVKPAFTGDRLFRDLTSTLLEARVLRAAEVPRFELVRPSLLLHAVASMHRATIILDDGIKASLKACNSRNNLSIDVNSIVPVTNAVGVSMFVSTVVFQTGLEPKRYCDAELLQILLPWDFDLELKPNELLGRLV